MAQTIGIVNKIEGKFYAKDSQGNLRELKNGDEVFTGEVIVPDHTNKQSDMLTIVDENNHIAKQLNSTHEQFLADSFFDQDNTTQLSFNMKEGFKFINSDTHSAKFAQLNGDRTDVNSDLRKKKFGGDDAQYQVEEGDSKENRFTLLDGDRTDVNSDLREASWFDMSQYFVLQGDELSPVGIESGRTFTVRDGDSTDIISDLRRAEWFDKPEEPPFNGDLDDESDAAIIAKNLEDNTTNGIPIAIDDARVIVREGGSSVGGQLLSNDIEGSDGLVSGKQLQEFTYNSTTYIFDNGHSSYTINGTTLGDLTVNQNGTWSLDPSGVSIGTHTEDSFSYKIVDSNGDISNSATQPLMMFDKDVDPDIVTSTSEDTQKIIIINDTSGDVKIIDNSTSNTKVLGTNESIDITDGTNVVGTVVNNGDGTITFTPSDHYCGNDAVFGYEVTRSDNTLIQNHSVTVTVTPTAESKASDTDNDSYNDVITQGDKIYADINESAMYSYISLSDLSVTNEDDRGNGTNPFASEITTVKLSGVPVGFKFQYNDGTNDHELTVSDVNDGVIVPFEYISTLQIKPTDYFAGEIKVKMEVITVDCEGGAPVDQDTNISSPDYLYLNVTHLANGIQALNAAQATGLEDAGRGNGNTTNDSNADIITDPTAGIDLDIDATTVDTSGREKVTTIIDDIPEGGAIYYSDANGAVTVDKDGVIIGSNNNVSVNDNGDGTWKITIADFKNNAPLKFIPPHNSNDDYTFEVTAYTVDGDSISSTSAPKTIDVVITGIADIPVHDNFIKVDSNETVNSNNTKNIYSDVLIEDNSNTHDGAIILFSDLYTEAGLASYDSDSSESLSVVITGLSNSFSVVDVAGISFNGASGTSREWSFDVADLANVQILTSKNYSGSVDFTVKHITTENDGDSKTDSKDVKVLVKPLVEATVTTSSNATEDTASQVDFSIVHHNGDTNETLDAIWINKADITGKDFTLYTDVGATTVLSAGANITDEGSYYKLTEAAIDNVYIKYNTNLGSANTSDNSFGIKYTVSDSVTANGDTFTNSNTGVSGVYNISLLSVTDSIAVDTSNGTSADNIVYNDGTPSVTINETGTFSFDVDVTSGDTDGSENFTRFVVEGVQRGITVDDPYATMAISGNTNIWFLDIPSQVINASGSTYTLNFKVNESLRHFDDSSLVKITAYAKDTGANANDIQTAQTTLTFVNNLPDPVGPGVSPEIDVDMNIHAIEVQEDTQFTLYTDASNRIIEIIGDGEGGNDDNSIDPTASVTYSLAFSNLTNVSFDTTDTYTNNHVNSYNGIHLITVTAQQQNIKTAINNVLSQIKMIADENYNENNAGSQLSFDVNLTAYIGDGWARDTTADQTFAVDVVPVTDEIISIVTKNNIDEDTSTTISITFDTVDNPDYTIVQSSVNNTPATTVAITHTSGVYGTLTWSGGGTYTFSDVNKIANIPVADINNGTLTFSPTQHISGTANFSYTVYAQEMGASNISETTKSFSINVSPVADGINLPDLSGSGDEDTFIQIYADKANSTSLDGATMIDTDGSESIISMFIDKVPENFLIYIGDSGSQTLATKGSTDGTVNLGAGVIDTYSWTINISGGIPKVWLKAPADWSSTTPIDLTLKTVVKDGSSTTTVTEDFQVTVDSVVDGFSSVTPNDTVQTVSLDTPINLNANAGDLDGSETGVLTLSGFGAGDVTFKQDGSVIASVYNGGTDTYTISNIDLSTDKLNELTFQKEGLQGVNIDYTFKTVESDDNEISTVLSGSFSATTDNIIANGDVGALGESDRLVLTNNQDIDFSLITATNVEKIDLTQNGDHDITNITYQDVIDMTEGANDLMIIADNGDNITLNGGDWSADATVNYGGETFQTYVNNTDPTVKVQISDEATLAVS